MNGEEKLKQEHPTSAIFSRSDRLRKALHDLCGNVECIEQALLGTELQKDPTEKTERAYISFLEDVKFRFDDHISEVEKIQSIVFTIKASLINAPTTTGSAKIGS